jgi:hypothetical protein
VEKEVQVQAGDKEIEIYFENKFLSKRIEFIEDYDFESDGRNYEYFKSFILNFEITKDDWYNTLIIDLSDRLNIIDNNLYNKYLKYLSFKTHYLFKLSILDYFINNYSFYKKIYRFEDFKTLYNMKSTRHIVKNQIVINNLVFFPKNKDIYIKELLINMKKTTDYRSHIRVFNYIMNFELDKTFSEKKLNDLINISSSKKLGRAVDLKLQEFKDYIQS